MSSRRLLSRIVSGTSDAGMRFEVLCIVLDSVGFEMRVRGSHHIFRRAGIDELLNLQRDGRDAKPYQVRQVRAVIVRHRLAGEE